MHLLKGTLTEQALLAFVVSAAANAVTSLQLRNYRIQSSLYSSDSDSIYAPFLLNNSLRLFTEIDNRRCHLQ